ncbi:MAG: hypothetical protein MR508_11065, partial [Lachnospiraceae bacterium]|nr:hypothetical protein [Lachnospiraceae bacterium]
DLLEADEKDITGDRAGKKEKKRRKKEKTKKDKNRTEDDEEEKTGGKLVLFLVTLLIVAIWLGIIAILIKSDVGGFGSSVLYPLLKDVPYVNKILPVPEGEVLLPEDTQYAFRSLDEAVDRIKELEAQLEETDTANQKNKKKIKKLREQVEELSTYKEEEAAFEKEKQKFYEEVVFSDEAPDINEYKAYYESIDPKNAEVLYKQVVEQTTYDDKVADYVKTYSQMKPKEAAAVFDTMTDDLGLVADILMNMGTAQRAAILGKMNAETAAKLTKIMEPSK